MTWFRASTSVVAVVYLAQLTPFFVGPLTECEHCSDLFLRYFVFVPGFMPTMQFGLEDKVFAAVAIGITLAILGALTLAVRKLPSRAAYSLLAVIALLAGFNAYGLSHVLRM